MLSINFDLLLPPKYPKNEQEDGMVDKIPAVTIHDPGHGLALAHD